MIGPDAVGMRGLNRELIMHGAQRGEPRLVRAMSKKKTTTIKLRPPLLP